MSLVQWHTGYCEGYSSARKEVPLSQRTPDSTLSSLHEPGTWNLLSQPFQSVRNCSWAENNTKKPQQVESWPSHLLSHCRRLQPALLSFLWRKWCHFQVQSVTSKGRTGSRHLSWVYLALWNKHHSFEDYRMVCGGRHLKYHPVPSPATDRGTSLFVCNEKGPFKRCDWRKPWLAWLMFHYCWSLDRKFWINYKAKTLRSSCQRWTSTFCDCFELVPSQQKGSFPIWWAWNDSPSTTPPSSWPTKALWLLWHLYLKPAFVYLHLPSRGENLLPMFFELVPISTAHTNSFPSTETKPALYHTQPLNKRSPCQDILISPEETPHNEMWQEKRDQLHSISSERCNNIDHIINFLNTRGQKLALTVIWAFHPFGFRRQNFVSSIINIQDYQYIYSQWCNSDLLSKNQW